MEFDTLSQCERVRQPMSTHCVLERQVGTDVAGKILLEQGVVDAQYGGVEDPTVVYVRVQMSHT